MSNQLSQLKPLLEIPLKLNKDCDFAGGKLLLTQEGLHTFYEAPSGYVEDLYIQKSDFGSFKVIHFVGAGMLVHQKGTSEETVAYFPKEDYGAFKYLEKAIEGSIQGESLHQDLIPKQQVCETCGQIIPEKAGYCPLCIKKTSAFKKIAVIAKGQVWLYVLTVLIFIAFTVIKIIPPIFYRRLIDEHLSPGVGTAKDIFMIILVIGLMEFLVQFMMVIRRLIMAKAASNLVRDLRDMIYAKLQSFSLSYIHRYKTGDLMNRITGDTRVVRNFIQQIGGDAINEILVLIAVSVMLFVMNWRLALLIYVPVPIMYLMIESFRNKLHRIYRKQERQWDKANSVLQEMISGIRVIKAFGLEERSIKAFDDESYRFAEISISNEKKWSTYFPIAYYVLMLGNLLLLYVGGQMILQEELSLGELIMFTQYATMLYQPLGWLGFFPRMLSQTAVAMERLFSIITHEPDIVDRPTQTDFDIEGHIEFKSVGFG